MAPIPPKKKAPAPDAGPDKPRLKIALKGHGSYIAKDRDEARAFLDGDLEAMIEGAETGTELTITLILMSDAEIEALPEFQGW